MNFKNAAEINDSGADRILRVRQEVKSTTIIIDAMIQF